MRFCTCHSHLYQVLRGFSLLLEPLQQTCVGHAEHNVDQNNWSTSISSVEKDT